MNPGDTWKRRQSSKKPARILLPSQICHPNHNRFSTRGWILGCTLEEAKSWGKISGKRKDVTCYCDVIIALPVITPALN
jgi:hypothetical protein